jgi:class 3 adenylate cyclase/tetratricopeptide (TPR) repeat protein
VIVCPSCGRESSDDAAFCARCGTSLVPPRDAREERKVVSIVFADLVGSTARSEQLDPEDVRAMLASYHGRVRAELERFGGTVEKFIGDAVVAVFGAPVVHEDDAERAVRAALAIREAMADADVRVRIAVNTGEALVSLDARPAEGEGMVAGDVVNTAARLQSAAPIGGVLVGEGTFRATAHTIEYQTAEPVVAKGKTEPVPVWEAVAPRARFGVDLEEAAPAPLVGRVEEVGLLRDALTRVRRAREPQLLTLVGVPGIGKSRLVTELFRIVEADRDLIFWRQGRCLPYGEGISFWALGEMAKAQAGILESDDAAEAERKLGEAVAAIVPDADETAWVTGHLRPLVGLSGAGGGTEGRGEAFAAWRRFLEGLAEQRPTVLVFEDLHWADDGLLDFIDGLVDRATGVPLLVVCGARPELLTRHPGWGGGKANAVTLSLAPLSGDDTARLIAQLLEQAVLPASMQQALLARAEGNPLFAEEYIRMLRDQGLLRRDGDVWRLETESVEVPPTVQGIIAARLDALPAAEKELVQDAAVLGKVFWLGAVTSVGGVERWGAEELLHSLERKELVRRERRASVAGEVEYAFRHVLVRDVAYGQIPRARRADLHLAAARWIESLAAERSEDRAEMLAHHYVSALELLRAAGRDASGVHEPAKAALREAGHRAYALSALGAAERSYRAALELCSEDDPERPRLLLEIGRVAVAAAGGRGSPELREAIPLLVGQADVEGAADAEALLGFLAWLSGSQSEARGHFDRAVALAEELPPSRTTVSARAARYRHLVLAGERPPVEEGEDILAQAKEFGTTEDVLQAWITLGAARNREGDLRGVEDLEGALAQALAVNSYVATRAYLNLASFTITLGDLERGRRLHREGLALATRFGSFNFRWFQSECVADDYLVGQWDEAVAAARELLDASAGTQHYLDISLYWVLASVAAAKNDRASALANAQEMLALAHEIGDPQALWPCLGAHGRVALECDERAAAETSVDEFVARLREATSIEGDLALLDGFVAVQTLGRGPDVAPLLDKASVRTPWVDAGAAVLNGEFARAADILSERDAATYAAYTRLLAAERRSDTRHLPEAIDFFRRVGATAYLARAEALLQATA